MPLILASNSPRRQELLRRSGLEFEVHASGFEPLPEPGESAEEFTRRAARAKASAVAASLPPGALVLAADTVLIADDEILGKPGGPQDAARMLRLLSGRTHRVVTGVCLILAPEHTEALENEITLVTFRKLDEREISEYISSGEPFDKAGAYGIQGLASKFVTRIEGCYFNVMGLPVARVYEMLKPHLQSLLRQ